MNELNFPPPAAFFSPLWGSQQWQPNSPKIRIEVTQNGLSQCTWKLSELHYNNFVATIP